MSYDAVGDEELVLSVSLGDRDALGELYTRHSRAVYGLALHFLRDPNRAEEVTQEVFINLWNKAGKFHPERGRFLPWLLTTAHHRTIDELRRNKRDRGAMTEIARFGISNNSTEESPAERAERLEDSQVVREALDILPQEQLQVVVLAYYNGYSHTEIAHILDQPLGTVKTRMRLAMQKLRASMALRRG